MLIPSFSLLILLFCNVQMSKLMSISFLNNTFIVDLSQLFDPHLLNGAMQTVEQIQEKTCLKLAIQNGGGQVENDGTKHRIHFVQSTPSGPCGLDSSFSNSRVKNLTIYLNSKCAPAIEVEIVCLRLLGLALTGRKTSTESVVPTINEHFFCPDHCPQICKNGGLLSPDDCTCQCPFNGLFDGENCEELIKLGEYTDSACGQVKVNNNNGEEGILKLSSPMDSNTYCQFLLLSDDPWAQFRVDFRGLEMSQKAAGTIDCPDKLQIYGLSSIPVFSVKCSAAESPKPGQSFASASNFLLFQLEANRFDSTQRQGPIIHYTLERSEYSEEIRLSHPNDPSDPRKSDSNSANAKGQYGGISDLLPSSNLSLIALLAAIAGVLAIVFILLALRRRSANRMKRNANGGHHTPVPSSPTPQHANGGC